MIIGSNLISFEELPSTNTYASMLLKKGEQKEGTVIQAGFQSAGKGQMGNKWDSEKDKNLLISIILYPSAVIPEDQFSISMAVSLGICDFLDNHIPGSTIKWPNDIYINDDKIAGILIENTLIGELIESTIAGIGLNINQVKYASGVSNPTSMKIASGREYNPTDCLKELLEVLDRRYKELLYGKRESLKNEYKGRLYWLNELHSFRSGNTIFKGTIKNISSAGLLMIETGKGDFKEFNFKEVVYL
jgi:BirA family biotin operon repressor/biotin-[acetyl-CoA-carboxylase] ligase